MVNSGSKPRYNWTLPLLTLLKTSKTHYWQLQDVKKEIIERISIGYSEILEDHPTDQKCLVECG